MAAETIVIDVIINSRNQTSEGMARATQAVDRFQQSVQRTQREVDRLDGRRANPRVTLVDKVSSRLSEINRGLSSFGSKVFKAPVQILDYATKPLQAIKNSLFSIKGLVAAIGTGMVANQLIAKPISLADAYSSAKIGFSTILGETEAEKMMDELDEFAKATPFKTSGVIDNAQKMMSMGWDVEDIINDMKIIGDAAASTGKGDMGFESIVRALSQIKTKGKLSTEELNQLAEAGIAAKAMLAEQMGYGTGDSGIAKMTEDLEDGLIQSDEAIQALLKGMQQFEGTMERTANETVEGLKSQIEDTFEINVLRRWGQGLQDGAKRGFGSIVELLDKSEGSLAKFGDTVYEIGKELSNWAADKLEDTIDKVIKITNREDFQNASIGGKVKILWDEVIAEPFADWWDSKGQPFMVEKMNSFGEAIGSGLSKSLLALLGVDISGATDDAVSIGGSFAQGFAKGFEGEKVWDALVDAAGKAFKTGFELLFSGSWLTNIIAVKLGWQLTTGIFGAINKVQTIWNGTGATTSAGDLTLAGMGMRNAIGSTGNYMFSGTGILGSLSALGYKATGFSPTTGMMYFGDMTGAMSGGMAALAGASTIAGIVGGVAGLGNSLVDMGHYAMAETENDKKHYEARAVTKLGMVGTGALIGTAIAPGIGTAIGAGIGGIATFIAGNKLADSISGVSKTTKEMNKEFENTAKKRMDKRFGEVSLSAEQLSKRVEEVFTTEHLTRVTKFNESLESLKTVQDSVANYHNSIRYTSARINAKEELSTSDVEEYKTSLQSYAESVSQLLNTNKTTSRSAFELLFGDDTDGLQKITEKMNSSYTKLEKELEEKTKSLNDVISEAFADGKIDIDEQAKIDEIIKQIDTIYAEIDKHIKEKEEAERNASYDLLETKYKDTDLKADSFKELVGSLNAQSEIDQKAYDDAYIQAKAEIDLELKTNPEYSQEEYNSDLEVIEQKWRDGKAISVEKAVNVSLNVLNEKFESEIETFEKNLKKNPNIGLSDGNVINIRNVTQTKHKIGRDGKVETTLGWKSNATKSFQEMRDNILNDLGVDGALQKELSSFYETLKPQEEDLLELKESYEQAGKEIPKWINDSLADIENIKLMSGDMDTFYKFFGEQFAQEDKEYAQRLLNEAGKELPKSFKEGLEKGISELEATEFKTNLKLTADEKGIDTTGLDKSTQKILEKLKEKEIIFTQDGEVKIKAKDGKIDTSNLDEETRKAVEKLQEDSIITIEKDGTIKFKTIEVETKTIDEATENALNTLKEDNVLEITKDGKVTITANGGIDVDDVDEKTRIALEQLKESGVIEIDKEGKVNVIANVVTDGAEETTKTETANALGKTQEVDMTANVSVRSETTGEDSAADKSKSETVVALNRQYQNVIPMIGYVHVNSSTTGGEEAANKSWNKEFKTPLEARFSTTLPVTGKANVTEISVSGATSAISTAFNTLRNKVKSIFSSTINVNGNATYHIGNTSISNSGTKTKNANGSYVDKPIQTIVGEAGPEYIIPVSPNRKQRGKYLWERAGRALGLYGTTTQEKVYFNANGGLYGSGSSRLNDTETSVSTNNLYSPTYSNSAANTMVDDASYSNKYLNSERTVFSPSTKEESRINSEIISNSSSTIGDSFVSENSKSESMLNGGKIFNYYASLLAGDTESNTVVNDGETTVKSSSDLGDLLKQANNSAQNTVNNTANVQNNNRNSTGENKKNDIHVNVGGITISVQSSGNNLQNDIAQQADTIADQIATILANAFQNIPVTVGT